MQASFPVRERGTMLTLLHARYELEDLLRMDNFQGQDHLQEPSDLGDRKRWCFFFQPDLEMPQKKMRQHTCQHMVMPPGVFAPFIVVQAQFGFRLLKALFKRPSHPTEPD